MYPFQMCCGKLFLIVVGAALIRRRRPYQSLETNHLAAGMLHIPIGWDIRPICCNQQVQAL